MKNLIKFLNYKNNLTVFLCIFIGCILLYFFINSCILNYNNLNIENFTTEQDLITCMTGDTIKCGTELTGYTEFRKGRGTCDEAYGVLSENPDPVKLSFCVPEPIPNPDTPAKNHLASVNASACTTLSHRHGQIQAEYTYIDPMTGETCHKKYQST